MKTHIKIKTFIITLITAMTISGVAISAHQPNSADAQSVLIPAPPSIGAKSYLLLDYQTMQPLVEQNSRDRLEPASLTKIMTVYVIDNALKEGKINRNDQVRISKKAWQTQGSKMFVEVDKYVKADDLIRGIIIQSGNDASVAMAEHVAGSEEAFADLMNQQAKKLGMNNTHFKNATGLPDPDHYSTAYDLAILAHAIIHDHADTYPLYSEKRFVFNNINQINRNRLLWRNLGVDGIKTGHTDNAGYCLVASAKQDDMRLISIVLGAPSDSVRADETEKLLTYGFRFYETHKLYDANQTLSDLRVWMGNKSNLPLGVTEDVYITIPQGQYKNLQAVMNLNDDVKAPIIANHPYGALTLKLGDSTLREIPLVALENVPEGNIWQRFTDYVQLSVHKMLN